jgi:hypothetical protein
MKIVTLLDGEIASLEARLSALRSARAALAGEGTISSRPRRAGTAASGARKRVGRRPGFRVSAKTKAKLRAAWKRRKAAQITK